METAERYPYLYLTRPARNPRGFETRERRGSSHQCRGRTMRWARRLAPFRRVLSATAAHEPPLITQRTGSVAILKFNRPQQLNAMTADMGNLFQQTVDKLCEECDHGNVRAVVLTGTGDQAFSAGGDLNWLIERTKDTPARNAVIMRNFYQCFLSIRKLPVPVVAAINGHAIGAGCCISLACDVRIAHPRAKIGVNFVSIGLHPGMGCTYFLPRLVGPQVATRMMLTGELVTAEQALTEKLINSVSRDPVEEATEIAQRMGNQGPIASRTCIKTIRAQVDVGLDAALWREADAQAQCYASKDVVEGVAAVREKRAACFDTLRVE